MPTFKKKTKQLSPARTLALGFLIIIAVGALLLFLPISSKSGTFTDIVTCIFTASSATCVTGISVVETYTHWSVFGQAVIMLLIQTGGLGFITLVTFFNIAIGKKLGFLKATAASGDLTMTGLSATKTIFVRVVTLSFVIETIGACLLMVRLVPAYGGYGVFMSFFTAVSAFCNAGFDLFGIETPGAGMAIYADDPYILTVVMLIIIIGGLGFVVWEELLAYRKTKTLSLHSRVVLITTAALIIGGAVIYFIIELTEPDVFGEYGVTQRIFTSFFASVSARTAGFSAAPLPTVNSFSKMFTIILMFIGAAPGSTGGGFKVTTFAIIAATAWSVIKDRNDTQILKHIVPKQAVYKTLTVLCLSLAFAISGTFIVSLMNPDNDSLDILFEVVSSFSTTGFSAGISENSGIATKLILSFIMYVGRIGPVSLMLSFAGRTGGEKSEILPQGEIMVG
ncbi:MAG: potassium transporter Trk [Oscillospiraceae bacterium]|nr:potassium transporter Trk [Oscillospiraceae bacterium]